MKRRHGFVSNSSSSSFVVLLPTRWNSKHCKPEELAMDVDVPKLREFGFGLTSCCHPSQLDITKFLPEDQQDKAEALGFDVGCNQDEVIEFLVKHDIPFTASCHYGHESVFFTRGDDCTITLQNYGLQYETYGQDYLREQFLANAGAKRTPIQEWQSQQGYGDED